MRLAGCIIRNDEGEILLIHRNTPDLTQWELPGGKVETDETEAAAAQREVEEELGIIATDLHSVGTTTFRENGVAYEYAWFTVGRVTGSPLPREEKHDKIAYFAVSDITGAEFSQNVRQLAAAIINGAVKL
ncbi:MAG: NUDIX hydrolase [Candidatus Saccharimonadales bacterium]